MCCECEASLLFDAGGRGETGLSRPFSRCVFSLKTLTYLFNLNVCSEEDVWDDAALMMEDNKTLSPLHALRLIRMQLGAMHKKDKELKLNMSKVEAEMHDQI